MSLYSFSKSSWHVRFYKWLFNEDATRRYKTMCPYFWTYVLIFLFIWAIIPIRACGKGTTKFFAWLRDYKHNRDQRRYERMADLVSDPNLTGLQAYNIARSKCYRNHSYYVEDVVRKRCDYDYERSNAIWTRFHELRWAYSDELQAKMEAQHELNLQAREKRKDDWETFAKNVDSAWNHKFWGWVIGGVMALVIAGLVFVLGYAAYLGLRLVDWNTFGYWAGISLIVIAICVVIIGLVYVLVMYVFKPFVEWLSCRKLPECGFCNRMKKFFGYFLYLKYIAYPFIYLAIYIGKGCAIIGHMIYSTYKKRCPIIEWKD